LEIDVTDEQELLSKFLEFADADYVPNSLFERARALLSASKPAVPEGWTLAPVKSTVEMDKAGFCALSGEDARLIDAERCYNAMLAASPAAPAQSGEPVEADVVPNEIAELLAEPCWNLSRRDVSDLLKRIGSILYTAPQPSQPAQSCGDAEQAAYSAPFTADMPHCCGNPDTCNDPCDPRASEQADGRDAWQPIETASKDGTEVWAFNGEQARMLWSEGQERALWAWADQLLADADPEPEQPTHWMPLPAAPSTGDQS
jgi:hypothetical protein